MDTQRNNLFSVTAPLSIKYPDGSKKLIIVKYPHSRGLLFFEPFWHINGLTQSVHLIKGEITGEGPWKIADHVITVTGCQGSDPDMASLVTEWQAYLSVPEQQYPDETQIRQLAAKLGAIT